MSYSYEDLIFAIKENSSIMKRILKKLEETPKKQMNDLAEIENRVVEACARHGIVGCTIRVIGRMFRPFSKLSPSQKVDLLSKLITDGRLEKHKSERSYVYAVKRKRNEIKPPIEVDPIDTEAQRQTDIEKKYGHLIKERFGE